MRVQKAQFEAVRGIDPDHPEETSRRCLRPLHRLGGGRVRLAGQDRELVDFSSNDYLGLAEDPAVIAASRQWLERLGAGAGAARLMSGDSVLCHELEEETARLKGTEAALVFGSGFLANVGIIPALVGREDRIYTDRLNHASIHDGCLLSRARVVRFRHNDCNHLEGLLQKDQGRGQRLIVVESIYSMDGDRCPLRDLLFLKERHGCRLMIDEAHATGVFGNHGGGIIEEEGAQSRVDIAMGTYGKALGSYGAYTACSREMADFLVNRARTFIFSTALPPAVIGAALAATRLVQEKPELRRELLGKVAFFKAALAQAGLPVLGQSQIIPIVIGASAAALSLASHLQDAGLFVTAVRPPTVPEGTARLRFSITRHHRQEDLTKAAGLLAGLVGAELPKVNVRVGVVDNGCVDW